MATTTSSVSSGHVLRQSPGRGVLARFGDLVLLCGPAPGAERTVETLIDVLSAAAGDQADGRQLSRLLTGLLASAGPGDALPALCAFGPVDGGVAVLAGGGATLTVTIGGRESRLDGREAVTVTDRVFVGPIESIEASIVDGQAATDTCRWSRLDVGVVRADALHFQFGGTVTPVPVPRDGTVGTVGTDGTHVEAEAIVALPGVELSTLGVHCKNRHFNDPTAAYCAICGSGMAQADRLPVMGSRPPLGVLVFDDGTTCPLHQDQVVGRAPDTDESVAAGTARPVPLRDPLVSRLHAKVVLRDWQVLIIDTGSANGTYLLPHGQTSWTRLVPGASTVLTPGAAVAFGDRRVRYFSHRNP